MSDNYVTVGTIQVELDGSTSLIKVLVTPTADFIVKFGKDSYIVLLPLDADKKKVLKAADEKFIEARFTKLENSSFPAIGFSASDLIHIAANRTTVERRFVVDPAAGTTLVASVKSLVSV